MALFLFEINRKLSFFFKEACFTEAGFIHFSLFTMRQYVTIRNNPQTVIATTFRLIEMLLQCTKMIDRIFLFVRLSFVALL